MTLPGIGLNPTRAGHLRDAAEMGADIAFENRREEGGEPVADLRVRFAPLQGHRGAAGAGAVDDRRVPDPRRAGGDAPRA